jgi:DNA-binding SARP family transcriptional activator
MAVNMEFCLLGPLMLRCDGVPVPTPPGKQQVVLAALLLRAGRVVSARELTELLWESAPPPSAQVTLRNYMRRLRHALGDADRSRISTQPGGYLMRVEAGELDVFRFEAQIKSAQAALRDRMWDQASARASEALSLWRGEPLADAGCEALAQRDAPWLAELHMQALEARIEAQLHLGDHAAVIAQVKSLTAEQPLREHLHGLLMRALYLSGRQSEALLAYQQARERLIDELGTEPGVELRELHQRILNADPALSAAESARVAPGGPGSGNGPAQGRGSPRNLPGSVYQFTGRRKELAALTGRLAQADTSRPSAALIWVIGGMAGIGKTALAVHWAHQVAERFPDGQLFVNLRGFDPMGTPVSPTDALSDLLDALGLPAEGIPPGLDARAGLYRSLLWARRVLVVLDNARDAAQVRPLLPGGPRCGVVITSRGPLAGLAAAEGARLLTLDLLPEAEARELLVRRLGAARLNAEPAAADELARACGGLPLALSVAAARVSAYPRLGLRALAEELTDAQRRLDALDAGDVATSVRAVFSWSLRGLPAPAARLFRLLSFHPGPDFTCPAAASLAGVALPEARRTLRELAEAHLISEHAPGRFGVHDLLRAYAAEQAAAVGDTLDGRMAVHRILDHYLHTVDAANRIIFPARERLALPAPQPNVRPQHLANAAQAQAWLQAERRVLIAAAYQAAALGFDRHAWQIPFSLSMFLAFQGHRDEWSAVQRSALAAAQRLGDQAAQARLHIGYAHACVSADLKQDGFAHLHHALDLYRQLEDRAGQGRAHVAFSLILNSQGRHREAFGHAQHALVLAWSTGSRPNLAQALNATGWTDAHLGNLPHALDCCQLALDLHRETGNRVGQAETLDSLGYIYQQSGDHGHAIASYQRSLSILRALASRHEEAVTRARLGDAHFAAGHPRKARKAWQRALAVFAEENHPNTGPVLWKLHCLRHPANGEGGGRGGL